MRNSCNEVERLSQAANYADNSKKWLGWDWRDLAKGGKDRGR